MAPSTTYSSAKDLLEYIGESVQKEAKKQALGRSESVLHGLLSNATIKGVKNKATKPIQLEYEYHTNVTGGFDKNNPCANRLDVRFSDIYGGQCTDNKINGNDDEKIVESSLGLYSFLSGLFFMPFPVSLSFKRHPGRM